MARKTAQKTARKRNAAPVAPAQMKEALRTLVGMFGDKDEIVTEDDLSALMKSLGGPSAYDRLSPAQADAKDEAQQLAFDAMEAESEAQARKLAKRALRLDPDCVDALVVMTDLDARTTREKIEGLQKAVTAGERSLGAKFIRENTGHFWMLIETRPWMRAMAQLAELLRTVGIRSDALRIYERMLSLNPNDNQGVRDPLLGLYLESGDIEGAGRLLKKYREDGSASFAWARVLERFLAGDRESASAALQKARKANRHVEQYLTERKSLPKELPEMYSPGSEEEAVFCLSCLGGAWAGHKEAAQWLTDRLQSSDARHAPRNHAGRSASTGRN